MSQQGGIIDRLCDRIRGKTVYTCVVCSMRFDRDRLNCPACGCSEFVKR